MAGPQEKRRYPRIERQLTLHSSSAEQGRVEMSTTNLSLGGIQARTDRFLPLMTRVEVTLQLGSSGETPSRLHTIQAEAVVVRIEPPAPSPEGRIYEMALFFSRMREADRTALADYLSTHAR